MNNLEFPTCLNKHIYLYGEFGSGKTQILKTIKDEILGKYPDKKILYTTLEQLLQEYEKYSWVAKEWEAKMNEYDILLVNYFDFLENKIDTQKALLRIFKNKQVFVASETKLVNFPIIQKHFKYYKV